MVKLFIDVRRRIIRFDNKKLIPKYNLTYISAGGTFYEENRSRMGFEELITLCLEVTSAALNNSLIFQNLSSEKSRKFVISSVFSSLDIFSQQAHNFGTSLFSHGSHSNQPICEQLEEIFETVCKENVPLRHNFSQVRPSTQVKVTHQKLQKSSIHQHHYHLEIFLDFVR